MGKRFFYLSALPGLFCLSLLLAPLAQAKEEGRIIGGEAVQSKSASVALVEKNSNAYRGYFCAGTLIHPRWVLTARHCVDDYNVKFFDVVVGRKNLRKTNGERISPAKMYFIHQDNQKYLYMDIALIYLSKKSTAPTLDISDTFPLPQDKARVEGWGAKKTFYPAKLQGGVVEVTSSQKCLEAYPYDFSPEDLLCVDSKNTGIDACWGDSGGGLIFNGKVVAVVSFGGDECALADFPTAYAKVNKRWIKNRLNNPPQKYKKIPPGEDSKKEPKPYLLLAFYEEIDLDINKYEFLIEVSSNFTIKKAKARLRGGKDLLFCSEEDSCVKNKEWFLLDHGSGMRHASKLFLRGNTYCPMIDFRVEIKHKKRFWKETVDLCGAQKSFFQKSYEYKAKF